MPTKFVGTFNPTLSMGLTPSCGLALLGSWCALSVLLVKGTWDFHLLIAFVIHYLMGAGTRLHLRSLDSSVLSRLGSCCQ